MSWIKQLRKVSPIAKYSQYGEDAYLDFIFQNIGVKHNFLVDIGANDGTWLSNTKIFRERGFDSILIEGREFPDLPFIKNHFVTAENIIEILDSYNCPIEFDLLSIDIDGNDYWVLKQLLTKFKPRVIVSEYNAEHDTEESKTIEYDPNFTFKANDHYGYTFKAGEKLAEKFGYKIIHQNANLNLYYVRKEIIGDTEVDEVPNVKFKWWGKGGDESQQKWVTI